MASHSPHSSGMDKQENKDEISRNEIIQKIMNSLGEDGVASRTVLVGEAGIGKTWLATEVSKRVEQKKSASYNVLWLHLNKKIGNEKSLYQTIAAKLSFFPEYEEGEEHELLHHYDLEVSLKSLKMEIGEKFIKEKQNLLLILEDEGSMTTEKHVMEDLGLQGFLQGYATQTTLKTLVIRREESKEDEPTTTIKVCPLTKDESVELLRDSEDLLKSYTVEDWPDLLQSLSKNGDITEPTLMSCIVSKSKLLPAAIVVLTKTLKSIKLLSTRQRKIFKELILSPKSLDEAAASKNAVDRSRYNPVLRLSYELLKPEETVKSPVIACFWHVLDFYKYSGCAYYRDLIVHWMLEGYFDPVKSVEKAYQQGHSILMEFMSRGILKVQEDNMVVPEMSMSNLLDLQDCGFFGRSCLGFDRVYGGDKTKGLGRVVVIDDMIKTIPSKKKKIRTLIVSGNRLRREVAEKFFEKQEMQDLEVVVLFDPTFHKLIESLSKLKKLRVLVIRDCDQIRNIDTLAVLDKLHVLEVSGACFIDEIPDEFFKNMTQLQSLNLSGLAIKSSPSTIENLSKLRCFILRECSELQDLPNFNVATRELEVIDIRGAKKLESYFDRVKDWKDYKGKNKNFAHLQRLEHLDFSESRIIRLPIFHLKDSNNDFSCMPALTRLLIRDCVRLKRLPQLKPLKNLQILDASGATMLVEMLEVCLEEKKELRILNMSETGLPELADTIADVVNLNQLLLRNCTKIQELPKIERLTHLEVFDVSGCNNLGKIDGTFEKMSYLHEVNLSGTNLNKLPKGISELPNIKKLILRNCSKPKSLPNLEKLIHLEVLDVSGCTELEKIDGTFKNMSYLNEVNLAGTKLQTFPELPDSSILCSSKRIVLADSRCIEKAEWSQVKKCLAEKPEGSTSAEAEDQTRETGEELVYQGKRYKVLDPESPMDIIDISQSTDVTSKAEYISISENESTTLSSIIDNMKSVKGVWVERCKKMETLFTSEEKSTSLETLWISNLPLLKTLHNSKEGFVFKNLKKLSIDCCPSIKFLFPEGSQLPEKLETLRVTFCDHLERLFEAAEGELTNLRKLYLLDAPLLSSVGVKAPKLEVSLYTVKKCPNWKATEEELRLGARKTEEITEVQPHNSVEQEEAQTSVGTRDYEKLTTDEMRNKIRSHAMALHQAAQFGRI